MINYVDQDAFEHAKEHGQETHCEYGFGMLGFGHLYEGKIYVRIYQPKDEEKYFYITCDNRKEWITVRNNEGKEKQFITMYNRQQNLDLI
jgi:hypothetical protein